MKTAMNNNRVGGFIIALGILIIASIVLMLTTSERVPVDQNPWHSAVFYPGNVNAGPVASLQPRYDQSYLPWKTGKRISRKASADKLLQETVPDEVIVKFVGEILFVQSCTTSLGNLLKHSG